MPAATESVLVVDVSQFNAPGSVVPTLELLFQPEQNIEPAQYEIREAALAGANAAGLTECAAGGSAFRAPHGLGVGRYNERMILCTERPLGSLRTRLAAGQGIRNLVGSTKLDGITVYHGRNTAERDDDDRRGKGSPTDCYVAVADDHTLVIASGESDAREILKLLAAPAHSVPEKWSVAAAEVNLDSPLLILRRYDPANDQDYMSPVNPKAPVDRAAKIDSIAVAMPDTHQRKLLVHAVTADGDNARRWLQREVLVHLKWGEMPSTRGIKAELTFDEKYDLLLLQVLVLFGPNVAI
jgi:hypothetical protein